MKGCGSNKDKNASGRFSPPSEDDNEEEEEGGGSEGKRGGEEATARSKGWGMGWEVSIALLGGGVWEAKGRRAPPLEQGLARS